MNARLGFSIAAHLEPDVLIIDEVLAVGDAHFQRKCMGKMSDVAGQGRTVLFVSHNLNAIEQLCDYAVLLEHGQIRQTSNDVRAVIKTHLLTSSGDAASSEWAPRPGTVSEPYFQPLRFRITDGGGKAAPMPGANNTEHWVEVEAEIADYDPALKVGYVLYSQDGTPIYQSHHTDRAETEWPALSSGHYVFRSRIPARFLNEGTYRIDLEAGLHSRQTLLESGKNSPSIFLTIRGGLSDSPYWMEKRPGILGPVMEWTVRPGG